MVRKAASFIVRNGPITMRDRWQEQAGFSPYALASSISGLLCAAEIIDPFEPDLGTYLRQTADAWNDSIERWTYATETSWAEENGVEGYYMHLVPHDPVTGQPLREGMVTQKYFLPPNNQVAAYEHISADALALVRFGLRAPDDPRIVDTLQMIDSTLKVETPLGPGWYRFSGDGYGEKADGSPFDQTGIGRLWPLLTGERAHYELAAGNIREARQLLAAMEKFSGRSGLMSEQIWDSPDLPERDLFFGLLTGSARPLVWAHAEHVKLLRSLRDGKVFDMPPYAADREVVDQVTSEHTVWRFDLRTTTLDAGRKLRIETLAPVQIHWSADHWLSAQDQASCDSGIGLHVTDLDTEELAEESDIVFTVFWKDQNRWEGEDFWVRVAPMSQEMATASTQRTAELRAIGRPRRLTRSAEASRRGTRS